MRPLATGMIDVVPVKQAAKELHMDVLTVRHLMQAGLLDIGFYSKRPGCKRGHYIVYRKLLDEEKERLGIE